VVTRATALLTGPLTAAAFRVVDPGAPGRVVPAPRWVVDPMLVRPDERVPVVALPAVRRLPRSVFWASWLRAAIWWGMGAFIAQEDPGGAPVAGSLRLVDPAALSTTVDAGGELVWVIGHGADGARVVFDRDARAVIGALAYRLVVLRNPHSPVDVDGRSQGVFALHPGVFQLAGQIDSYASGTFRSGIPAGYLKTTVPNLSQEAADLLKAKWLEAHGGDRRSIAVLNAQTDFQALNLSPVDAALAEVKKLNVADVAFAFALDPMTLGAGLNNSATYSNLRDAWDNHADFGLAPWIAAIEDTLGALLPGGWVVSVDLDRFANDPPATRYAAYKTAIDAGVMTPAWAAAQEGLPAPGPDPTVLPPPKDLPS
jgi:hypothetical protein